MNALRSFRWTVLICATVACGAEAPEAVRDGGTPPMSTPYDSGLGPDYCSSPTWTSFAQDFVATYCSASCHYPGAGLGNRVLTDENGAPTLAKFADLTRIAGPKPECFITHPADPISGCDRSVIGSAPRAPPYPSRADRRCMVKWILADLP